MAFFRFDGIYRMERYWDFGLIFFWDIEMLPQLVKKHGLVGEIAHFVRGCFPLNPPFTLW